MMLLKLVFSHQKTLSIGFIMRDTSDLASCIGLIGIVVSAQPEVVHATTSMWIITDFPVYM